MHNWENCWDWNQSVWWLRKLDWDGLVTWNIRMILTGLHVDNDGMEGTKQRERLRKPWCDVVKENVKRFGLSQEYASLRENYQLTQIHLDDGHSTDICICVCVCVIWLCGHVQIRTSAFYYLFPVTVRLIVATKLYPTPIVCRLLCFVKSSRPVLVFSPYKEVGVFFGGVWMY